MLVSGIIAKGDNAGKPKFTVTITKDFLAEWLEQLTVVARGTVDTEVESVMGAWLAKSRPASVEMDVESF